MALGALTTLLDSRLPPAAGMDLIPAKPLASAEPAVVAAYRETLPSLPARIRPLAGPPLLCDSSRDWMLKIDRGATPRHEGGTRGTVLPEPSSLAFLGLGVAGLGVAAAQGELSSHPSRQEARPCGGRWSSSRHGRPDARVLETLLIGKLAPIIGRAPGGRAGKGTHAGSDFPNCSIGSALPTLTSCRWISNLRSRKRWRVSTSTDLGPPSCALKHILRCVRNSLTISLGVSTPW